MNFHFDVEMEGTNKPDLYGSYKARLVYQVKEIHPNPLSQVFEDEEMAKRAGVFLLQAATVMQRQWIIAPVVSKVNPIEQAEDPEQPTPQT